MFLRNELWPQHEEYIYSPAPARWDDEVKYSKKRKYILAAQNITENIF